jgi:hypothetical protein
MAWEHNPVHITVQGESFALPCRIRCIVWSGTTTAGDVLLVTKLVSGDPVFQAQASGTNTYLASPHLAAPCLTGWKVETMTAETDVLVYLEEE